MNFRNLKSARVDGSVSRRTVIAQLGAGAVGTIAGMALAGCGGGNGSSVAQALGSGSASTYGREVATQLMIDEQNHVKLLQSALGSAAIAKPAINLAALGAVTNEVQFLTVARALEDVGVSAYLGAAGLISSKSILGTAAAILAVEALHSGNIREQIAIKSIQTSPLDSSDVLPPPSGSNFFTENSQSLAISRTVAQVLQIAAPFFPNGINGTTSPQNDTDILNFALNLEYLEAEFYTYAVTGHGIQQAGLSVAGAGTQGATTGMSAAVTFTD